MRVLITGGGLIGAYAARELVASGEIVTVLDISPDRQYLNSIIRSPVEIIKGAVQDFSLLEQLFETHHFDAVVHTAGLLRTRMLEDPWAGFQTNVTGSAGIAELVRRFKVGHLIYISSLAVYDLGTAATEILEDHPKLPISAYDYSKWVTEQWLTAVFQGSNALLTILRPAGIYGYGQFTGGSWMGRIIHDLVLAALREDSAPIVVEEEKFGTSECLYVKDMAQAIALALKPCAGRRPYEILNVGPGMVNGACSLAIALQQVFPEANVLYRDADGAPPDFLNRNGPLSIGRAKELLCYMPRFAELTKGLADYRSELLLFSTCEPHMESTDSSLAVSETL